MLSGLMAIGTGAAAHSSIIKRMAIGIARDMDRPTWPVTGSQLPKEKHGPKGIGSQMINRITITITIKIRLDDALFMARENCVQRNCFNHQWISLKT
jgi:hypothetical protein